MTRIYYTYINKDRHDKLLLNILSRSPKNYSKKLLKYKRWQDAQLSLLGRLLLEYGLRKFEGNFHQKDIIYTNNSKPYFKDKSIEFNISHSQNIVVTAISNTCEIGIDVELIRKIRIEDFKIQMTNREWKQINSAKKSNAFFDYWTKKESVLKSHGGGFSIPLTSFEVIDNYTSINDSNFYLKEIKLNNQFKCHLAFRNTIDFNVSKPIEMDSYILLQNLLSYPT